MIGLNDLCGLMMENEIKISELQAENRVLSKLIDIEKSKNVEQVNEQPEEVVEEFEQQEEIC